MKYLLLLLGVANAGTISWDAITGEQYTNVDCDTPGVIHAAMCGRALSSSGDPTPPPCDLSETDCNASGGACEWDPDAGVDGECKPSGSSTPGGSGPTPVNCHYHHGDQSGCDSQGSACSWDPNAGAVGECHSSSTDSGHSGSSCSAAEGFGVLSDGGEETLFCPNNEVGTRTATCSGGTTTVESSCKPVGDFTDASKKQAAREALKNGMSGGGKQTKATWEAEYTGSDLETDRKTVQQAAKTARRDYLGTQRTNGADWKDLVIEDDADFVGYTDKVLAKRQARIDAGKTGKIRYRVAPVGLPCSFSSPDLKLTKEDGMDTVDPEGCVTIRVFGEPGVIKMTKNDNNGVITFDLECNDGASSPGLDVGDEFTCQGRVWDIGTVTTQSDEFVGETIWVSAGQDTGEPYYNFFTDAGCTAASTGELTPDTQYMFKRCDDPATSLPYTSHPFAVNSSSGWQPSEVYDEGLKGDQSVIVTTGSSGTVGWKCTNHPIMADDFCVGALDVCGVCNGPGAIHDCGCDAIPDGDCDCDGSVLDCDGTCGGTAVLSGCDNQCGSTKTNDCAGNCGGSAVDLGCGCNQPGPSGCDNTCGSTKTNDCAGNCGGNAVLSGCDNTCGSTKTNDCAGTCGGNAVLSGCDNQCGSTKTNDCAGVCGGSTQVDTCGVCGGSGPSGCDNVCGSTKAVDCAGTCGGTAVDDSGGCCIDTDRDCAGVCGGAAVTDDCGVCSTESNFEQPGQHMFCNATSGQEEIRTECPKGEGVLTYENVAYNEDYTCVACSVDDQEYSNIPDHSRCQDHLECPEGEGTSLSNDKVNVCTPCVNSFSSQPSYDSCTAWKTCGLGEYQTEPPSSTQDRKCATKVCSGCANGVDAQGEECGLNEGDDCESCNDNYSLYEKRCHENSADTDGDGVLNGKEISDDTDPTDAGSFKPCSTSIAKNFIDAQCCQCP